MSDTPAKPPTIAELTWMLGLALFKREAIMYVAGVGVIVACSVGGVVWAQDKLDAGIDTKLVPLERRTAKTEASVEALEKRIANVERMTLETNLNTRLVLERFGVKPVTLEAPKDAGQ